MIKTIAAFVVRFKSIIKQALIFIGMSAIFLCVGFYYGFNYCDTKYKAAATIQSAKNAEKLRDAISEAETRTRILYERKIKVIKDINRLPDTCLLSANFRMLHDSATGLPEVATAQAVTVKQVADTVINNYANCQQNSIWLEECNAICK